jgi:hypothetical protein
MSATCKTRNIICHMLEHGCMVLLLLHVAVDAQRACVNINQLNTHARPWAYAIDSAGSWGVGDQGSD